MKKKNTQRKSATDTPNEALEKMMSDRLVYSWRELDQVKRRGDQYRRYIFGDPPARIMDMGKGRTDEKLLTEAQREARALGRGWIVATHPMHGITRAAILPSMVSKDGTWVDQQKPLPKEGTDPAIIQRIELFNGRQAIFRELAIKISKYSDGKQVLRSAVDDSLQYGMGWLESDFDSEAQIGRIRWESVKRVFVDCEADQDPLGTLRRWDAVAWAMPIDEADYLLKHVWNVGEGAWAKADHKFTPLQWMQQTETSEVATWMNSAGSTGAQELPSRLCKLVRVYKNGESPYTDVANLDASTGEAVEKAGDDPVYSNGKDEILIFEAQGEMTEASQYVLIARYPAPFPARPLTPVMLTDDNDSFYKPPYYQASHSMCVAANGAIRSFITKMFQLSRTIIGYNSGSFNKKMFEAAFMGTDQMNLVDFSKAGDMSRAFAALTMGDVPKDLETGIGMTKALFDESSAREVLEVEQRSHQPATNAALQDAQKQLRLDEMADRVEHAYHAAMEKALVACSALMTAEQVAYHIGDEFMGWYTDETGARKSKYWDDEIDDPRALRERVEIQIEARSIRFSNPAQEIQNLERFMGKFIELASQVATANQTNPQLAAELAKVGNAFLKEYAEMLHLNHRQDLNVDLNAALTPPQEEPQQPEPPPPPEEQMEIQQSTKPDGSHSVKIKGPKSDPSVLMAHRLAARGMDVHASKAAQAPLPSKGPSA